MSDEYAAGGVVRAALFVLGHGQPVSIRLDYDPAWIEVTDINIGEWGGGVIHACRASDGHTMVFPACQLAAVDLGVPPQ